MWMLLEAVEYRDVGHWRWRLTSAEGAFVADHEVSLERSAAEYEGFINLGAYVRHQTDPDDPLRSEQQALRRVGEWLGREVLGAVGRALVDAAPVTVRVRVPGGAEELLYRPLELGHVGGRPLVLQDVSLVLEPGGGEVPSKQAIGDRLRMLAVFSLPTGHSPLGLRAERRALSQLAREMVGRYEKAVELRVLQYGVTRERLGEVLEEGEGWDVVHFSGHGLPGGLVLEKVDGSQDVVATGDLVPLLRPSRRQLKLVTLSSCSSAAATAERTLRLLGIEPPRAGESGADEDHRVVPALAARLVEELGCAVLAMRYPVLDEFAVRLGEELYDRLLRQRQPLARALQLALPRAVGEEPEPGRPAISVATPALFGRLASELELRLPEAGELKYEKGKTAGVPPEPVRLVGRTGALARASGVLAPRSGRSGVLFLGMAGGGKTTCALELVYRHQENYRAVVWYKAPDEGVEIRGALGEFAMELEARLPGLRVAHLVERVEELKGQLPQLQQFFAEHAVLVVVDNLESLLSEGGSWRDERWGLVLGALMGQRGLSRLVLTSRRRPPGVDDVMQVESIHALTLEESVLLARELPNLGALLRGSAPGVEAGRGRELVVRTLEVVQGHPKLIELADGAAGEVGGLEARLAEAERASVDRERLRAFFGTGRTEVGEAEQVRVLEGWARGAAAGLGEGSRTLFWLLCCLEEADREQHVLEGNWGDLWRRLGREGEAPELEEVLVPLMERALVESMVVGVEGGGRYHRVHPAVAEAGRGQAPAGFQEAVDTELAAYWQAIYQHGREREAEGLGPLVVLAGRRAAPYLVRLQLWSLVGGVLEQVLNRDRSPAAVAAVLPILRQVASATQGTEDELSAAGRLARVLRYARPEEAEAMMRDVVERAVRQGDNATAAVATGDLVNLLRDRGRLREALAEVERTADLSARAGLGPWTQLSDQAQRQQIMMLLGDYEQVLAEVSELRQRMAALPDQRAANETVEPWRVRENLLDTGSSAALRLERWEEALDFVEEIQQSERRRQAPPLQQARTAFNANHPLIELGRLDQARGVLDRCRQVFEREHDLAGLGKVFGALAILETRLGHHDDAREFSERSLRYAYATAEVEDIILGHHNLAIRLDRLGGASEQALAHSIAGLIVAFQTHSGHLHALLAGVQMALLAEGGQAALPTSFDELRERVEPVPGVRFRELFAHLPQRAPDGDAALAQVLQAVAQLPPPVPDIDRLLANWQPIIADAVTAAGGDQAAAKRLRPELAELAQRQDWTALVAAIERVLDGERDQTSLLARLDPIDTAILNQILGQLGDAAQERSSH